MAKAKPPKNKINLNLLTGKSTDYWGASHTPLETHDDQIGRYHRAVNWRFQLGTRSKEAAATAKQAVEDTKRNKDNNPTPANIRLHQQALEKAKKKDAHVTMTTRKHKKYKKKHEGMGDQISQGEIPEHPMKPTPKMQTNPKANIRKKTKP